MLLQDLGDASMRVVFGWTYEITVSATEGALNLLKTAFTESFTSWDEDIHVCCTRLSI